MRIRTVEAKSILNTSKIHDYCVNPYTGCEVGCAYCYAGLFIPRYSGHSEPWGSFVDVKINSPELLRRQLLRAKKGEVWISSVCDPYQPVEREYGLTRHCLEELLHSDFPVDIQTKSSLILRDADLLSSLPDVQAGFSIGSDDEAMIRLFEPKSSSVRDRIGALKTLRDRGLRTYAFAGPLLPGNPVRLAGLLDGAVDRVLIDRMNYSGHIRAFYARHGLSEFLTDEFFRNQADRLASELSRRSIPFRMLF